MVKSQSLLTAVNPKPLDVNFLKTEEKDLEESSGTVQHINSEDDNNRLEVSNQEL